MRLPAAAAAAAICLWAFQTAPAAENEQGPAIQAPALPEVLSNPEEYGLVAETADIVNLSKDGAYLNKGKADGLLEGMVIPVFRKEAIADLNGKILNVKENKIGQIRIEKVEENYAVGSPATQGLEFRKGDMARFVREPADKNDDTDSEPAPEWLCPEGARFFEGGSFAYMPGGLSAYEVGEKTESAVEPFCMQIEPQPPKPLLWNEARNWCEKHGMRLCSKNELRNACTMQNAAEASCESWKSNEPAPGACEGTKLEKFGQAFEWTGDWTPAAGSLELEAASCRCLGGAPSCAGCIYESCPGIHKTFRCCRDPLPVSAPESGQ